MFQGQSGWEWRFKAEERPRVRNDASCCPVSSNLTCCRSYVPESLSKFLSDSEHSTLFASSNSLHVPTHSRPAPTMKRNLHTSRESTRTQFAWYRPSRTARLTFDTSEDAIYILQLIHGRHVPMFGQHCAANRHQ